MFAVVVYTSSVRCGSVIHFHVLRDFIHKFRLFLAAGHIVWWL